MAIARYLYRQKQMRLLALLLLASLAAGCGKSQFDIDQEEIEAYVADNNLDAQKTESGLWYVIEVEGSGDRPTLQDEVTVLYTGYLTDGTVFDQTSGQPITFPLANVIKGWQEGIPLFREGGNGLLIIPSQLGYGSRRTGSIPPNSVLVFEVQLVAVN